MTHLNGHAPVFKFKEPMVTRRVHLRVVHELVKAKNELRRLKWAKTQLEENIAIERQIWKLTEDGRGNV